MGSQFSIRLPTELQRRLATYLDRTNAQLAYSWDKKTRTDVIVKALERFLSAEEISAAGNVTPRHPSGISDVTQPATKKAASAAARKKR